MPFTSPTIPKLCKNVNNCYTCMVEVQLRQVCLKCVIHYSATISKLHRKTLLNRGEGGHYVPSIQHDRIIFDVPVGEH